MSYWNKPGKIELLKKLWTSGLSASAISKKLGDGATRNSVIGKTHRLKLEKRITLKKPKDQKNTEKNTSSEITAQKLGRKKKFQALLIDSNFPEENPTPLHALTDDLCRWPLGEKMEPAKLFCGRKTVEKEGGTFSYCELHLLHGYVSRNEKEEDAINDEDVQKFISKKIKSA